MMPRLRSATDFGTANSLLPLQRRANLLKPPEFDLRVSGFPDRLPETIIKPHNLCPSQIQYLQSKIQREGSEQKTQRTKGETKGVVAIASIAINAPVASYFDGGACLSYQLVTSGSFPRRVKVEPCCCDHYLRHQMRIQVHYLTHCRCRTRLRMC